MTKTEQKIIYFYVFICRFVRESLLCVEWDFVKVTQTHVHNDAVGGPCIKSQHTKTKPQKRRNETKQERSRNINTSFCSIAIAELWLLLLLLMMTTGVVAVSQFERNNNNKREIEFVLAVLPKHPFYGRLRSTDYMSHGNSNTKSDYMR